MTGKDPHRPQGKTKDMESMATIAATDGIPSTGPSQKKQHEMDLRHKEAGWSGPTEVSAEEQVGGSRPGVPSRVKDAIANRKED